MVLAFFMPTLSTRGAPTYGVELNFDPRLNDGADIYAIAMQTNGRILIAGSFTSIGNVPITNIARLNGDGSLDTTFNPRSAADYGYVNAIVVQNDGKILIGGYFYSTGWIDQGIFTRLNADGTVDTEFDQHLYVDATVNAILVQPDGKILIGGTFVIVNFELRRNLARLNPNGTLDYGFDACVASSDGSGATSLALQSDGSVLAGGLLTFDTGLKRNGVARLSSAGVVDPNYAPEPGVATGETVYCLALRPDESLLFGGSFQGYHSAPRNGIAQLTPYGSIDGDFDPGLGVNKGGAVYALAAQPDGQMIVAGNFTAFNGQTRNGIARIDTYGSLDAPCTAGSGPDNSISSMIVQSNGKIVLAGKFATFDGQPRHGICRLRLVPPAPRLGVPRRAGDGHLEMTLFGEGGVHYTVEASTDLLNWGAITNFIAPVSDVPLFDTEANAFTSRFYRVLAE